MNNFLSNFMLVASFLSILLIQPSLQDIYLHNPRGSNNRLNEKSAQRTNANRLFDSQNNGRGGYNVGDLTSEPFKTENDQYQMKYFQSSSQAESVLKVEWTSQHGCGGNENTDPTKQNCDLILQYMCQESTAFAKTDLDRLRDGLNTNAQGYSGMGDADTGADHDTRKKTDVDLEGPIMEDWNSYDACNYRERNAGLFIADQKLKNNNKGYSSAVFTRQNPNGNRRGYECPEERDYYPYWHPTAWKDIAVLTGNTSLCKYFEENSFNVNAKYLCVEKYSDGTFKHWSRWNNQLDCVKNDGTWTEFSNYLEKATNLKTESACRSSSIGTKWAIPYDSKTMQKECLVMLLRPICSQAEWTRSNHLGNTKEGESPGFHWKLPHFPSKKLQKCSFRIRYNITTDDYAPYETDHKFNSPNSPVNNNPKVNIGANNQVLKLAINTAQYGRTFQDRSHTFYLMPRPVEVPSASRVFNLNVRGKRGNIVQVYPAVEYDFIPNKLNIKTNDLLHIQWTGSNTHNNAPPGGDGQTGDAGEGKTGTDRSNIAQINHLNENFPIPFEMTDMWQDINVIGFLNKEINTNDFSKYLVKFKATSKDLALYLSSTGYYECVKSEICVKSYESIKPLLDSDLNTAPASLPGVLVRFKKTNKQYSYMCSRNNNFSNRSQKGTINVVN